MEPLPAHPDSEAPPPDAEAPPPVWILYAVFGTSAASVLVFVVLMVAGWTPAAGNPVADECRAHLTRIHREVARWTAEEGGDFRTLLEDHGRGATILPLVRYLEREGRLPSPPPHTAECKSWRNYTVIDNQNPRLDGLTCFVHGGRPEGVPGPGPGAADGGPS